MGAVQNEANFDWELRPPPQIRPLELRLRPWTLDTAGTTCCDMKKQNAFETVMSRTWPVKILGLLLAIVAVVLMSEILSVLLNLPEDKVGVLRRFK
jgi:hypothetical protein